MILTTFRIIDICIYFVYHMRSLIISVVTDVP